MNVFPKTKRSATATVEPDPLWEEFIENDEDYRYAYAEDFLNTYIATQIKVLRDERGMKQGELAEAIGTKQSGISRLENVNYSNWKTETLKKVARALGVRLHISFETFGTLLKQDATFSVETLKRPKFEDDPVFTTARVRQIPESALKDLASIGGPREGHSSGIGPESNDPLNELAKAGEKYGTLGR